MTREDKQYYNKLHRLGRIATVISLLFMLGIPFIVGVYYDAMPKVADIILYAVPFAAIFYPLGLSEFITYVPIVGTSIYLTTITGNVSNLKIPAATNAQKMLGVLPNSEAGEVISGIAVMISTIVTMVTLVLGYLLINQLGGIFNSYFFQTAANYVFPAILGPLMFVVFTPYVGKTKVKNKYYTFLPAAIVLAVMTTIIVGVFGESIFDSVRGWLIILSIIVLIISIFIMCKKNVVKVVEE